MGIKILEKITLIKSRLNRDDFFASHQVADEMLEWPRAHEAAPSWSSAGKRPPRSPSKEYTLEIANGWPALAVHGGMTATDFIRVTDSFGAIVFERKLWFQSRVIPLVPLWPGFLIDTLFYAALWLGLIVGFGAARRTLRKRRGRCPMCAYDLRGNLDAGCPECGWNRSDDQTPGEAGG